MLCHAILHKQLTDKKNLTKRALLLLLLRRCEAESKATSYEWQWHTIGTPGTSPHQEKQKNKLWRRYAKSSHQSTRTAPTRRLRLLVSCFSIAKRSERAEILRGVVCLSDPFLFRERNTNGISRLTKYTYPR